MQRVRKTIQQLIVYYLTFIGKYAMHIQAKNTHSNIQIKYIDKGGSEQPPLAAAGKELKFGMGRNDKIILLYPPQCAYCFSKSAEWILTVWKRDTLHATTILHTFSTFCHYARLASLMTRLSIERMWSHSA